MNALLAIVAASVVGVDVGWQPITDGGLEYIIQIEPQLLDTLRDGKDLTSELPPGFNVRRYRITVGNAVLPHDAGQLEAAQNTADQNTAAQKISDPPATATDSNTHDASPKDPSSQDDAPPQSDLQPTGPKASAPDDPGTQPAGEPTPADRQSDSDPEPIRRDGGPFGLTIGGDASAAERTEPSALPGRASDDISAHDKANVDRSSDSFDTARGNGSAGDAEPAAQTPPRALDPDSTPSLPPRTFNDDQLKSAVHNASKLPVPAASPSDDVAVHPQDEQPKPWLVLVLTGLGLCVSVGGNAYLGWVAWGARMRYRELLNDLRTASAVG